MGTPYRLHQLQLQRSCLKLLFQHPLDDLTIGDALYSGHSLPALLDGLSPRPLAKQFSTRSRLRHLSLEVPKTPKKCKIY